MSAPAIELFQFSHSHYNEKARWALDFKGLVHARHCVLPGPHMLQMKRLSGQTQVPVLRIDGTVIPGSAAIVDAIETRVASPPLYPADPAAREEALDLQRKLDDELGPEVRRGVFHGTLDDPDWIVRCFASEKPVWKQRAYRFAFPAIRAAMRKSMNITPATGQRATQRGLGRPHSPAPTVPATGYLVGDSFTVADLAAAALLGPVLRVEHPDMSRNGEETPALRALCDEWAPHPAIMWAENLYRRHRPPRRGIILA
jgi:glutathione S-transferase